MYNSSSNWRDSRGLGTLTYVYNVAILVDHNVTIMPILDLQQITDEGIGSHRFNKIGACRLEFLGAFIAILMLEVLG